MTKAGTVRKRELSQLTAGGQATEELAGFFRVFADATRLRILARLSLTPQNVGELARELGMTQSAVSHQLRTLRDSRLVRAHKQGKTVSYSLDDEHIETILGDGFAHTAELWNGRN